MKANRDERRNATLAAAVGAALILGSVGTGAAWAQQANEPQTSTQQSSSGSAAVAPKAELREAQQQVEDAGEAIEEARAESREAVREGREAGRAAQIAAREEQQEQQEQQTQQQQQTGQAQQTGQMQQSGAASTSAEERSRTAAAGSAASQTGASSGQASTAAAGSTGADGVWLFVPTAMSTQTEQQSKDCWVRLYSGDDFEGRYITITGPTAIDSLKSPYGTGLNNWESAIVGRNATVMTYDGQNFDDRSATLRGGQRYSDLGDEKLGLFKDIESIRVTCGAGTGR